MTQVKIGQIAYLRASALADYKKDQFGYDKGQEKFFGERMNKYLIGTLVVIAALGLGLTAAFVLSGIFNNAALNGFAANQNFTGRPGSGLTGGYGMMRGYGMMGGYAPNIQQSTGSRISLDQAVQIVETYTASVGSNYQASEIMEFTNNFYAAVVEKDTGKAAFEILVDPYTGHVFPEYGPNMMWNVKYGHMGNGSSQENTVTFEQAQADAQTTLDAQVPGFSGQVWLHTWHGQFITEKELAK